MKAIFACKLYKASSRKDKIQAAIADPVNAELVEQLASYLDEEYQVPIQEDRVDLDTDDGAGEGDSSSKGNLGEGNKPSGGRRPSGAFGGHSGDPDTLLDDLVDNDEGGGIDDIDNVEPGDDPTLDDEPVIEESTKLSGESISASSIISLDVDALANVLDEIKGLLNLRDDTSGVSRIRVKECELWIHYNDNINLNNVMTNVVELLEASGYVYLEFNRLARSENAIVFQLSVTDTGVGTEESNE